MSQTTAPAGTTDLVPGPQRGPIAQVYAALRPVRGRLLLAMGIQALSTASLVVSLAAVVALGRALTQHSTADHSGMDRGAATTAVVVAVTAYVARVLLLVSAATVSHLADADFQLDLRRRLARHIGRLPLGWFTANGSGTVKKLAADDVSALHAFVAHALLDIVDGLVLPVLVFAYLCTVDLGLALLSLIPLLVGGALYRYALRGSTELMPAYFTALAKVNSAVVEFVRGISVVRTFGQTGRTHSSYRRATDEYNDFFTSWSMQTARESAAAVTAFSAPASVLVSAIGGVVWIHAGWMTPVDLVAFLLMASSLTSSMYPLISNSQALQTAGLSAREIGAMLGTPGLPQPSSAVVPRGEVVRFEHVDFGYTDHELVLHDITLELRPGTVTALVGRSGAGKSTLAILLPRFYDATNGRISIGGVDVRDMASGELYRHVSFVFQDAGLLRVSVADNIALGRPGAPRSAIEDAARRAAIHERITALPDGYDTVIGDAVSLSGGEAQRVAIARALLADAPILVLDEALSHADPDSEADVQRALTELARGRTVLTIAHRLRTVTDADQIAVLDEGELVELGTHDQLLTTGGTYATLWAAGDTPEHSGPEASATAPSGTDTR